MPPSLHYKKAISEHWRQQLLLIKRAEFNLCLLKQFCFGRKGNTRHTTGLSIKIKTCNAINSFKSKNFSFIVQMCQENDMANTQSLNTVLCE